MLQANGITLDLDEFEQLSAEGRRLLDAGQPDRAAETLRRALGRWRGPPLADLSYEPFAQTEIARLDELRLLALESRIDADLAAGRAEELVPELDALVREHPLRERAHAQLMLALYRSGRQADALEAYRRVRRVLDKELGLEPGPELRELERAILRQDSALEKPRRAPAVLCGRRRAPALLAAGAFLLAAAAAGAVYAVSRGSGSAGLASLAPNTIGQIDAATNRIVAQVPVGARPEAVAAGDGSIWVANTGDGTVARIDPGSHTIVRTIAAGDVLDSLASGGHVWLIASLGTVSRVDAHFNSLQPVARLARVNWIGPQRGLAFGFGSLWASNPDGLVSRIDPATGRMLAQIDVGNGAGGIAVGAGAVWVANWRDGTVSRIDPANTVTATIPVGHGPREVAVGAGAVWVTNFFDGTVVRIEPATNAVAATMRVGGGPLGIAATPAAVWVANSGNGTISRIDPRRGEVVRTIAVGSRPMRLVAVGGSVWVTAQQSPVPVSSGGTARFELASDPVLDPAVSYDPDSWRILYATCAHLLNYPDEAGPGGSRLVPEVAAAKPTVSTDGRTYTFNVRPGFRFSPPSNEPVTALTFKHSIERALDPRTRGGAAPLLADIVGARAFMDGKARHIAGIVARDRTFTIRLVAPSGDLAARLSIPSFCAVPLDAPVDPKGVIGIPAAGPYYVASYAPGAQVVLKRNPNYRGERPHRLAEIDIRVGVGQEEELRDVEAGRADYAAGGIPSAARDRLAARYGPGSVAARNGRQRYFTNPGLNVRFLILNTERPLFSDARLRRAVNYAIDRPALVAEMRRHFSSGLFGGGSPTDQYLPAAVRGSSSSSPLYPLDGPDLSTARRLAGGQHRSAVLFACNKPPCPQIAAIVRRNLAEIGIDVQIREMPTAVMFARAQAPCAAFDILLLGWFSDYPDPADFLNLLFSKRSSAVARSANYSHFSDPGYERELAAAARLSGAKRYRVYSALARRLARDAAPAVAYETEESRDFFSARMGCQLYQPIYGMDIGALCLRS